MNSLALHRLVKLAPLGMAVFSVFLMAHGLHAVSNGDPLGPGGPNMHSIVSGDPGGVGGPDMHTFVSGDPGGQGGPT